MGNRRSGEKDRELMKKLSWGDRGSEQVPRVEANDFCGLFDVKVVKEEEENEGKKEDHEENEADEKEEGYCWEDFCSSPLVKGSVTD